ncbi:MAG: hypothetical protein EOP12_00585 [Pseudomonas sp.]|nr:MAG: hypothetical protein EOP12_00585 [Pseudomonas sp.]
MSSIAYEFLSDLANARLPVVIYDAELIEQLQCYASQKLLIINPFDLANRNRVQPPSGRSMKVIKLTLAGRFTVWRARKSFLRLH